MLVARDEWEDWEPDRGAVVDHLTSLVARGRIDLAEFEELAGAAYSASTYQELAAIVGSAPPLVQLTPAARRRTEPLEIEVGHGQIILDRRWQLAERTNVYVRFGQIKLDLSVAEWDSPTIDMSLEVGHGQIVLTIPDGVRVTFERVSANINNELRDSVLLPGAPELRLTTDVQYGQIILRSPKVRRKMRRQLRRSRRRVGA